MTSLKKRNSVLSRLKRDESGTMAIAWALGMAVMLGVIAAAVDVAMLSNAKSDAQSIADTTALTAAVYVKTHGRAPKSDGDDGTNDGLTEGNHSAASLGYQFNNYVINGADGVNIHVDYDDNAKEVVTTVTGKTAPAIMTLLGKSELNFKSQSVVSYLEIDEAFPASIALVLDNSGSMQFDDKLAINVHEVTHERACVTGRNGDGKYVREWVWNGRRWRQQWQWQSNDTCYDAPHKHGTQAPGAKIRLDGLKASVVQFQTDLRARLGEEDDGSRKTVRMGMLPYSSSTIDDDDDDDRAGLYNMTWGYLPVGTPGGTTGIHGMKADGGTNSSPPMTRAKTWMLAENAFHSAEAIRTNTQDKDPLKFVVFMTDGQNTVGNWQFTPGQTGQWHRQRSNGSYHTENWPRSGYTEGTATLLTDTETAQACEDMKNNQNVTIFTIGYALEDFGDFRVNGWNNWEDDRIYPISSSVQSAAYNLMESCASSSDHFIKAADSSKLEEAFDEIQNAIVEELIRIKS